MFGCLVKLVLIPVLTCFPLLCFNLWFFIIMTNISIFIIGCWIFFFFGKPNNWPCRAHITVCEQILFELLKQYLIFDFSDGTLQVEKKKSEWHFLYFGTVSLYSVIVEMATNLVLIAYVFTYTRYMTFDENKPHSNESNNNKHSFSEFFTMHVYIYVVGWDWNSRALFSNSFIRLFPNWIHPSISSSKVQDGDYLVGDF